MTREASKPGSRWFVCSLCGFFWASHGFYDDAPCENCERTGTILIADTGLEAHELGRKWFTGPGG